jgi:Uma2 family endonuclease
MQTAEPTPRRFTRTEYYRMGELGLFEGQRVELMDGEIGQMSPQGSRHAAIVSAIHELLRAAFGRRFTLRVQMPLAINDTLEPEPDLAVVAGRARDFMDSHPSTAALVVEVADGSLLYDRKRKTGVYARAGIPEYWIVDLKHGVVQVCRQPRVSDRKAGYSDIALLRKGDSIQPLGAPRAKIDLADVLP